jgi:hypothetical protein
MIVELNAEQKSQLADALSQLPGNSAPFAFVYHDGFRLMMDEQIQVTYLPECGWAIECPYAMGVGNTLTEAREVYNDNYTISHKDEIDIAPAVSEHPDWSAYDDCPF